MSLISVGRQAAQRRHRQLELARLREIGDLKENWDTYGAGPIDRGCIERAVWLMEVLGWPAGFQTAPTTKGGVAIEWSESPQEDREYRMVVFEFIPNAEGAPKGDVFFTEDPT